MRTLSGISLLFGALLCAQAAQGDSIPLSKKKRFSQKASYEGDVGTAGCISFDFETESNLEEGDWFEYCEGEVGPDLKCDYGWINGVNTDQSGWFCVDFTWQGTGSNQGRHLWVSNGGGSAVKASDCKGAIPLEMYRSDTDNGMCGHIPSGFTNAFQFNETNDNDKCFSIHLGSYPKEGSSIGDYCDGGDKTCTTNSATISMIRSGILDTQSNPDKNWTCVDLMQPDSTYQYLWMEEGGDLAAVSMTSKCSLGMPPVDAQQYSIKSADSGTACPTLDLSSIKHFNPDGDDQQCRSFDFSQPMGVYGNNHNFQWCYGNQTLKAECTQTTLEDMTIGPDENWFCVEFKDRNEDDTFMWVKKDGSAAKLVADCDGTPPPNDADSLANGRCDGLPDKLINTLKFFDFDGHCQSFNFTEDTTGGDQPGRTMYSSFRYCREGAENDNSIYPPMKRECDSDARIKRIHDRDDDWVCLELTSPENKFDGDKDHVWFNPNSNEAVMSSDCKDQTVLEFRQSGLKYGEGMCQALPSELTGKTFRFWGHSPNLEGEKDCRSFNFQPFISTFQEAYTGKQNAMNGPRDDADLFEFCQGTGGRKECTSKVHRSDKDEGVHVPDDTSSITMFNVHRVDENDPSTNWYCVQFDYNFTDMTDSKELSLWMNAGTGDDMVKAAFLSDDPCDTAPQNDIEFDYLVDGDCQVIPSDARKEIRWSQGDDRFLSVDFSDHPGRLDGGDTFEYCVHNGHCYHATVMNVSNPNPDMADDVCIDFTYTTTYGLDEIHRGVWVNDNSASLVTMCQTDGSAKNSFNPGMVQRLPGELQDKLSFWQSGTCISFGFNEPPTEQKPSDLTYCEDVNHNNWCASTVSLMEAINPDDPSKQNWYCVTLSYTDEYGLEDMHRYIWFNPHHFEWNVGYGEVVKMCDPSMIPNAPSSIPNDGSNVLRQGMCQNFPNVHPYSNPSHNSD